MAFKYKNYTESDTVKKRKKQAAKYETYNESQDVIDSRNAYKDFESNKVADWTGGTYGQLVTDQMNKINNREKFTYDLNGDALYQQYKDQYMTQGRLASADAIGQASAMTGGYGNSYAATVGNQAYQGYLQKLNDVVPELYNMAFNRYQQEGQDMKDMLAIYERAYGREYGEHRDKVSDYNTELARLQDAYYNEKNFDWNTFSSNRDFYNTAYNNERTYDYGLYSDAYNRAFGQYQQGVSEDQWKKSYNLQKKQADQSSTIASLRQQLKDEKNNKAQIVEDMKTVANSEATQTFTASILTPSEFTRRGKTSTVGGKSKRFDNHNQYVSAVLEDWYNKGELTENEVAYLKGYYGID